MSDYCRHGTAPPNCWICRCKKAEAQVAELLAKEEADDFELIEANERQAVRLGKLEAENHALEEERNYWKMTAGRLEGALDVYKADTKLKHEKNAKLRQALDKYGDHAVRCYGRSHEKCECGFTQALLEANDE